MASGVGEGFYPLWQVSLPGLQPRRIGNLYTDEPGMTAWSPDGKLLYYGQTRHDPERSMGRPTTTETSPAGFLAGKQAGKHIHIFSR